MDALEKLKYPVGPMQRLATPLDRVSDRIQEISDGSDLVRVRGAGELGERLRVQLQQQR